VLLETHDHDLELKTHVGISSNGLRAIQYLCSAFVTESSKFSSGVAVADTRRDDKFRKLSGLKTSDILSFGCIPLKIEDKTVGILYLDSTIAARSFSLRDIDRFAQFSKLIVKALIRSQEIRSPFPWINDYLTEHSIEELERKRLIAILARHDWRVSHAYRAAGIPQRTLYNVMARLGIKRPKREKFVGAKSTAQRA